MGETKNLVGRLRDFVARLPRTEADDATASLVMEAVDRIEFLQSVAGAVNKWPSPIEALRRQSGDDPT